VAASQPGIIIVYTQALRLQSVLSLKKLESTEDVTFQNDVRETIAWSFVPELDNQVLEDAMNRGGRRASYDVLTLSLEVGEIDRDSYDPFEGQGRFFGLAGL
jgi:hypothetical protein